ncbi:MAG: bifunctional folylpolyglutamate synthase/dihydrofolate synthase [Desulfuromonas sp.]|jgi:dihydrofolate synthase/folylpolyglutamate synthase|nr:MAG: bifunctional folylpolyglutamate synthase/dihydrofolate synthase [Desulfuromonas sp.]
MGYQAGLDYLYSLQRFGIKLGLENTARLLERLGNPQSDLRIIHIAGTNGKGSTAAALASILGHAGITVGLYTSPHLHSFTERIQLNGQPVSESVVACLIEEIRPVAMELGTTFFEFATALALLCFKRHGVQWAVLEVGMGGRLDATNVVLPELVLVTPVSLDHSEHLGDSLAAVAAEKAGIFKPRIPVLSARQAQSAQRVISGRANELQAPLFCAGEHFHWQANGAGFDYQGPGLSLDGLVSGLRGRHQQENLSLALAAAELLQQLGVPISCEAMRRGIAGVRWPGRLEWCRERILLDGAHNPAGADALGRYLAEEQLQQVHWVVGIKADKDYRGIMDPILPRIGRLYACAPPVEAAVPPHELVAYAESAGVPAAVFDSPERALTAARNAAGASESVLVAGSLFLIADVREGLLAVDSGQPQMTAECLTGSTR